jgi:hypothetical protein
LIVTTAEVLGRDGSRYNGAVTPDVATATDGGLIEAAKWLSGFNCAVSTPQKKLGTDEITSIGGSMSVIDAPRREPPPIGTGS